MYRDSDLENIFQVPVTYCQLDVDVKQMAKECINYYNEYDYYNHYTYSKYKFSKGKIS